ncbi:MAG: hypothetical protein LBV07_03550 [Syntrophobacterales bacterium]|jgi:hypothetical protein|nr:hypothetical protein [Syntrophobacterales bacterium]
MDLEKNKNTHKRKNKFWGKTNIIVVILLCAAALIFWGKDKPGDNKAAGTFADIPPPQQRERPAPLIIIIRQVLLQPSEPTRQDTIHAEVFLAESAKGKQFQYVYAWKVNSQPIPNSGDTLELAGFKIGDLITVTVTPYDDNGAAPAKTSQPLNIRAVPPSLDIQGTKDNISPGEPFTCQLVSKHPDSETVTFSLEEPKLEGMTIHEKTGLITWSIPETKKTTWEFGASVVDPAGNKTIKTFTLGFNPDSSVSTGAN